MKYLKIITVVLIICFWVTLEAQEIHIHRKSANQSDWTLQNLSHITFPSGQMVFTYKSGNYKSLPISDINALLFDANVKDLISVAEQSTSGLVYPNPFSDHLNLKDENNEIVRIEIYAMDGKLCLSQRVGETSVNTSQLLSGIYLCRLIGTHRVHTQKIIKR